MPRRATPSTGTATGVTVETLALRPVIPAVEAHRNNAFACRLCNARLMAAVRSYRKQTIDCLLTVKANQPTVQANVERVVPDPGAPLFCPNNMPAANDASVRKMAGP